MIWRCDLVPQFENYRPALLAAMERVLTSGRYVLADEVAAFEKEFAAWVGAPFGVGVNSGTDALLLPLALFDLEAGDEVITTPFTAIPTYSAIRHAGATPVFVDIEPDTFLMDLEKISAALTPRTRAVVPVHIFGNVLDVERLRAIVGEKIHILEDCAQSHGASIRGRMTGTIADVAAFSFYPTKNLGGYGDGGLVTTCRSDWADLMKKRRMYGMISKDEFVMDGINTRLAELQAAFLRVKLKHLDAMNARRRELAALYAKLLPAEFIIPQAVRPGVDSVWHVFSAICRHSRDALLRHLEQRGIQANVYYPMPLPKQKAYRAAFTREFSLPVAEDICQRVIALPFYPEMTEETLRTVAAAVTEFFSDGQPSRNA